MTKTNLGMGIAFLAAGTVLAIAAPPTANAPARSFELQSTRGKTVRLSDLTAQGPVALVVLRGFPGYQCPFCTKQVHDFVQHAKEFADDGVRVVMVYPGPAQDLDQRASEFLQDKDFPAAFEMLLDPDYKFTNMYDLRWDAPRETAHPATFLIAKGGKILFAKISDSHGDRMSASALLEQIKTSMR